MRTILTALAVVLGLALWTGSARAGGWTLEDYLANGKAHDWAGYGVGTMIHTRTTRTMTVRGGSAPQHLVEEERKTLLQLTATEYVFQVETLNDGRWTKRTAREPKTTGLEAVVADAGAGQVAVGTQSYVCRKKRVRWMRDGQVTQEAMVWVQPGQGILRMSWKDEVEGETRTTKLAATRRIGTVTIHVREQSIRTSTPGVPTMKGTLWVSQDVPERMVRMEMSGSRGPTTFRVVQEVVSFLRK